MAAAGVDGVVDLAALNLSYVQQAGAPVIHDEADAQMIHDTKGNVAVKLLVDHNDVDAALESADFVFESEYRVHSSALGTIISNRRLACSWTS